MASYVAKTKDAHFFWIIYATTTFLDRQVWLYVCGGWENVRDAGALYTGHSKVFPSIYQNYNITTRKSTVRLENILRFYCP